LTSDPSIRRAFEIGAKNQHTLMLVKNWCAHARIEKAGGTGMIEQMTGHPVGHHGIACDFAPAGGWATWDLADAALDFHDRNCGGCRHRKPVGFPNLTTLVNERDVAVEAQRQREQEEGKAATTALAVRKSERQQLREQVDTLPATVVDQIEALDSERSTALMEALVATARLAPDAFSPPLIDHLFRLVEKNEIWATDTALQILLELKAEPVRLARCAMLALSEGNAAETAAAVMIATIPHVDSMRIPGSLRTLVELANPLRIPFFGHDAQPQPDALRALHAVNPTIIESTLEDFLVDPDLQTTSIGARGIAVLARGDAHAASRLARAAISRLARSNDISDHDNREIVNALCETAAMAYEHDPHAAEGHIEGFLLGASPLGQGRLFSVYRWVLDDRRGAAKAGPSEAQHVALRKLIWAATQSLTDEVRHEIEGVFQGGLYGLKPLAAQHIDALLGAAALLDDRLQKLDDADKVPAENFLEGMERRNRRSSVSYLQQNFVGWAADASAGNTHATEQYVALLASLPEHSNRLRAIMIGEMNKLITAPETFGLVIPTLYSALFGASALGRGHAASVIGAIRSRDRDDAPLLLLEAFVTLLDDPFQYPVSAVVSAMERFTLPDTLKDRVGKKLFRIILAYAQNKTESEFLVKCISLFVHSHLTEEQLKGKVGYSIVALLEGHAPKSYIDELPYFGKAFTDAPAYGRLVVKALEDDEVMAYRSENIIRALRSLPSALVAANREALLRVDLRASNMNLKTQLYVVLVEVFTGAGDWDAAEQIAHTALSNIPDTRRERRKRLTIRLVLAAVAYERAIAEGRLQDLTQRSTDWKDLQTELHKDETS
jgi:hypothetical protein